MLVMKVAIEPSEMRVGYSDGPATGEVVRFTLDRQLAVMAEMVGELHTLTFAGQAHNMAKIVGFIDHAGARILRTVSARNQHTFAQLLADLELEGQRPLPDAARFRRKADNLITLLVAAADASRGTTEKVADRRSSSPEAKAPPRPGSTPPQSLPLVDDRPAL